MGDTAAMSDPYAVAQTHHTVRLADGRTFGPADIATIVKWAMEGRVPQDSTIESDSGAPPVRAGDHPAVRQVFVAPPTLAGPMSTPSTGDDAITTLIPYRNGFALASYYVGVFSLIPGLGLILGVVAIVLGVIGLRHASRNAQAKGRVHAWVGIVLGSLVIVGHVALIVGLVLSK